MFTISKAFKKEMVRTEALDWNINCVKPNHQTMRRYWLPVCRALWESSGSKHSGSSSSDGNSESTELSSPEKP